jgi:hypothetical protein
MAIARDPLYNIDKLFIGLDSFGWAATPEGLVDWLEEIRQEGGLKELVLTSVGNKDGQMWYNYLDLMAPYLPGGATPAFEKVWLGTVDSIPWTGDPELWWMASADAAFRETYISHAVRTAKAFKARYPGIQIHGWYIGYEGVLNVLQNKTVSDGQKKLNTDLMNALNEIVPGKPYLWSPFSGLDVEDMTPADQVALRTNLRDQASGLPSPLEVAWQDGLGTAWRTKEDAVKYFHWLAETWPSVPLSVNAELYDQFGTGGAARVSEVRDRLTYYAENDVPIGPCWEIRWWHALMQDVPPMPPPEPEPEPEPVTTETRYPGGTTFTIAPGENGDMILRTSTPSA